MQYAIRHRTQYQYAQPVRDSFNELRLQPASSDRQTVEAFLLKILPATRLQSYRDFYQNNVHHFEIAEPHTRLAIESQFHVTTHPPPPLPLDARPADLTQIQPALQTEQLHDFVLASQYADTDLPTWKTALDVTAGETDVWQCALRLMEFVYRHLSYEPNSTHVHTHMRDVLAQRRGVCQDFAHVFIGLGRCLQIPSRYISGYLATETASATHAWVEVFIPGHGWQPLDPTHNCIPGETYVKIAAGRDYADVAPVRGTYRGVTTHQMNVEIRIESRP